MATSLLALPGRHDWRSGSGRYCVICELERRPVADWPGEWVYLVGGQWQDTPAACVPRVLEKLPGLFSVKDAALFGLSKDQVYTRTAVRRIRPAFVTDKGAYLWRWTEMRKLAQSDKEWRDAR